MTVEAPSVWNPVGQDMNTSVPIDLSVELSLNNILIKETMYTLGPLRLSAELSTQYYVNRTQ